MTFLIIEIGKRLTNYFHGTKVFGKALYDAFFHSRLYHWITEKESKYAARFIGKLNPMSPFWNEYEWLFIFERFPHTIEIWILNFKSFWHRRF